MSAVRHTSGEYAVGRSGGSYVVRKAGEIVARGYTSVHNAEAKADALEAQSRRKLRNCIRCRDEFLSEGAHHRMCAPCRAGASDIFDGAV